MKHELQNLTSLKVFILGYTAFVLRQRLFPFFQVLKVRTIHDQLSRLMSATEKGELRMNDAFSPFSGLDPLLYNPFTDPLWKSAIEQFERAIQPTEDKVSGKLRQKLRELDLASYQVVNALAHNVFGFF